ncbi:MAG: acyl-CoA dehydrogenase [Acidimicrobiales bacterium]
MGIAITEEHQALAAAARRFLESRCPPEVAREPLDAEDEAIPAFWPELASLGWLGLAVPEVDGGQGFGLSELAVVIEELGYAAVPGPFLPTALAVALISRGGTGALRSEVLAPLVAGTATAAVALPAATALSCSPPDVAGVVTVSGTSRPVLGSALADWLVLPAGEGEAQRWCVLPACDLSVTELASLDPTRRSGSVAVEGLSVPSSRQLRVSRRSGDKVVMALVAAECAGGAAWCVETASEYAKVREQFGRPIGQFQAVKHRCADMLVALEQARAVAWDALDALDHLERNDAGGGSLSVAVAAAVAPDCFLRVAKDCIQVLGGLGFTWEHDAHRYLRRAITARQLSGGSESWLDRVAGLALGGARRELSVDLPADSDSLRGEIRAEVEAIASKPRPERRRALAEAGLFAPHWPEPWGRDAGAVEQLVTDEELRRAGLRRANLAVGAWAAPTIVAHGTPEQQQRWVGPTLLGEIRWCQLFSEPGAGSDLAALSTRAVRTDGGWLLTGQKVWTSLAAEADWGICLARSDPSAPKHLGITYFVVDMRRPGIEVRPLRELTGHAMFNEVFLTEVFVPDDCVIGKVNGGWPLARTTLANERVAMGSGASFGGGTEGLLALVAERGRAEDPVTRQRVGAVVAESHAVALLGLRSTHRAVAGASPGPEASVRKLLSAEHDQRTQELGLELLGAEGATAEGAADQWSYGFLANRCLTIAGGTSEVQRNVIAERLLGLPRDP